LEIKVPIYKVNSLENLQFGASLGVSHHTVRSHIDLMEQAFILRVLPPYAANIKKRLVKSPKVYVRDSGLLHALLGIETQNDLLGHPVYGASWEGYVIESLIGMLPNWQPSFYRTASGVELDLVIEKAGRRLAVECKASTSPQIGRGFRTAMADLGIEAGWVIAPVEDAYPISPGIMVAPPHVFIERMLQDPGASG